MGMNPPIFWPAAITATITAVSSVSSPAMGKRHVANATANGAMRMTAGSIMHPMPAPPLPS